MRRTAESGRWIVRHGAGVTRYVHRERGIRHELAIFVHPSDPVRFALLTVANQSGRPRRLSAFGYNEWRLCPPRAGEELHVWTESDPDTSSLLAESPLLAEEVVVMLREPMGFVADVLQQPQGERAAAQDQRFGSALNEDLFLPLGQGEDGGWIDAEGVEGVAVAEVAAAAGEPEPAQDASIRVPE